MGRVILKDITFDIYRGEYTILYAKSVHSETIITLENIITGKNKENYLVRKGWSSCLVGWENVIVAN